MIQKLLQDLSQYLSAGIWLIAGVIIGIIGPYIATSIRNYLNRPVISIGKDVPLEGNGCVFHSIRIANTGKTTIKNCSVLLSISNLARQNIFSHPSAFMQPNSYRPIKDEPLCWAFATHTACGEIINPPFIDIYPNSTQLIDLCVVHYDNAESPIDVDLPSEAGWEPSRARLDGKVEYDVELKIYAENITYKTSHFKRFKIRPTIKDPFI